MNIWDTAGQEQYNSLSIAFYRGTNVCVLTFDLANKESFDNLDKWKKNFIENANVSEPEKYPFVLVGNKNDILDRQVSQEDIEAWRAANNNLVYLETGGLHGSNVESAFNKVAEIGLENEPKGDDLMAMPTSLSGAQGAIKMNPTDDVRRSMAL